jgi:hypothetical protein
MASDSCRAFSALPNEGNGYALHGRELSPVLTEALHNAPGRRFYLSRDGIFSRQTREQVAGRAVAGGLECTT